jgi:hypothetical protein
MDPVAIVTPRTQLAIFIADRPGTLARACQSLAEAGINIDALATEGGSRGGELLVRMVVNDPVKAARILSEVGVHVIETTVLMIEGGNQPGMLAQIADRLARFDVNIESVYLSATANAAKCLVILRPSDVEKAQLALRDLYGSSD